MKYFTLILLFSSLVFTKDITIPSLTIRGLDAFKSEKISMFLVSAKVNAFSKKKTINAVIKKLSSSTITTPDMSMNETILDRSLAKSYAPNYILLAIHTQDELAINKNVKSPLFEKAVNLDKDNIVAPTIGNRKFTKILLLPVSVLRTNPIISL